MTVLVTGGAGFIGSHTCVELLDLGYDVVIVDNLCNSSEIIIDRIIEITNKKPKFYKYDVCSKEDMKEVFEQNNIDSIIHFAALKAVGESIERPVEYYKNNLMSTIVLIELMKEFKVKNFVFSSSATVYGNPEKCPILEDFSLSATNPYGRTKLIIEDILKDLYVADNSLNIALLRYFNPIGAHKSGKIGEEPNGIPNNLMPYITKVAIGKLDKLNIFGDDYPTHDGTGVRDFIHVLDLASGHIKALEKFNENPGLVIYNLGTGKGYSVLDIVRAFSKASGKEIPYEITQRRAGDVAMCYADCSKAERELKWKAKYGLREMCEDSWRWQKLNPDGYKK